MKDNIKKFPLMTDERSRFFDDKINAILTHLNELTYGDIKSILSIINNQTDNIINANKVSY